jgi:hypothetical protein
VRAQVVKHDHLACSQGWPEDVLDIRLYDVVIGRTRDQHSGCHSSCRESRDDRRISRQVAWKFGMRTLTTRRTRIDWRQVEVVAALIDNHEAIGGMLQHLQAKPAASSFIAFTCC